MENFLAPSFRPVPRNPRLPLRVSGNPGRLSRDSKSGVAAGGAISWDEGLALDASGNVGIANSLVLGGGTATKQSSGSGGPEKLSFQDSAANKVCIANFVTTDSTENARFLLDMQGNLEWAGEDDVDQNVLLGWSDVGRLNLQGVPETEGGLGIVSWKNSKLTNNITASQTSFLVDDGSQFPAAPPNYTVRCEDELMTVTGKSGNTLTVTRGVAPSAAATHDSGKLITALGQPEAHPRIALNLKDSTIKFSDGQTAADAFISRPAPGRIYIEGDALVAKSGGKVGFCGIAPVTKPTVEGSRGGNVALANLLTALADLGLILDSTS